MCGKFFLKKIFILNLDFAAYQKLTKRRKNRQTNKHFEKLDNMESIIVEYKTDL